jgi:protein gp37
MSDLTDIEWVRGRDGKRGGTNNPVRGGHCQASEECDNCYADTWAERWRGVPGHPYEQGFDLRFCPEQLLGGKHSSGPIRRRAHKRWFTCSMSDLFQPGVPDEYIARVWLTFGFTGPTYRPDPSTWQEFLVLSKRPARMAAWLRKWADLDQRRAWVEQLHQVGIPKLKQYGPVADPGMPELARFGSLKQQLDAILGWPAALPNAWIGTSAGNQPRARLRIPKLLECNAVVRWLSLEPLLGPLSLLEWLAGARCHGCGWSGPTAELTQLADEDQACPRCAATWKGSAVELGVNLGIDWVVTGGESGPKARPMHPDWARLLRDECVAHGVPFFYKQHGAHAVVPAGAPGSRQVWVDHAGRAYRGSRRELAATPLPPGSVRVRYVGKGRAGHLLDGRAWTQLPDPFPQTKVV